MRLRMLFVPVVASAALLAGCTGTPTPEPSPTTNGVEALEADAILERATEAMVEAESVHVAGTVGADDLTIDLDLVYAGDDVAGTVGIFGVDAELIKIGADVYVKADPELFAQFLPEDQQSLLPMFEGKWVKINETLVVGVIPVPLELEAVLEPTAPLEKGEVTTVNGTQAITVTDADGAEFHVSIEPGEPYLLDITVEGGAITFSDFDESPEIEAPAEDEVLDIMEMLGLA